MCRWGIAGGARRARRGRGRGDGTRASCRSGRTSTPAPTLTPRPHTREASRVQVGRRDAALHLAADGGMIPAKTLPTPTSSWSPTPSDAATGRTRRPRMRRCSARPGTARARPHMSSSCSFTCTRPARVEGRRTCPWTARGPGRPSRTNPRTPGWAGSWAPRAGAHKPPVRGAGDHAPEGAAGPGGEHPRRPRVRPHAAPDEWRAVPKRTATAPLRRAAA